MQTHFFLLLFIILVKLSLLFHCFFVSRVSTLHTSTKCIYSANNIINFFKTELLLFILNWVTGDSSNNAVHRALFLMNSNRELNVIAGWIIYFHWLLISQRENRETKWTKLQAKGFMYRMQKVVKSILWISEAIDVGSVEKNVDVCCAMLFMKKTKQKKPTHTIVFML